MPHCNILNFVGAGLILGDGVLTPAVTIVSAMEGLQIGIPSISRSERAVLSTFHCSRCPEVL